MERNKYRTNVEKIFLITFCNSLIFAYVIERIFAIERGLSILEIQYLLIVYSVASLTLEIPCGVLADIWKKKYVLALGYFFCFFEFFISLFAYDFSAFSLAFLAAAVGGSMKSGTLEAILYQSLKETGNQDQFEKLQGYLKFLKYSVGGLSGIIGGLTADALGLEACYWLSLLGFPFSILLSLSLYETKIKRNKKEPKEAVILFTHIRDSMRVVAKIPSVGFVILFGGVARAVLYGQLYEMSSIVYPEIGIPLGAFGLISLSVSLLGGIGGMIAAQLKKKFGYPKVFGAILFLSSASVYLFGRASVAWHLLFLGVAIFLLEMVSPLAGGYIQHRVEDGYRATVASLESFVLQVLRIFAGLFFGFFADGYSIFAAFKALAWFLGILGCIAYFCFLRANRRERNFRFNN